MTDEKSIFVSEFRFRRDEAQRSATRDLVASGSALTGPYLAMNAAATLLAGFGLLQNSPAVIIGAMLIAMLYGPLVGIALGLAEANLPGTIPCACSGSFRGVSCLRKAVQPACMKV